MCFNCNTIVASRVCFNLARFFGRCCYFLRSFASQEPVIMSSTALSSRCRPCMNQPSLDSHLLAAAATSAKYPELPTGPAAFSLNRFQSLFIPPHQTTSSFRLLLVSMPFSLAPFLSILVPVRSVHNPVRAVMKCR